MVRDRHEKGQDIRPEALYRVCPGFYFARRRLYGGDAMALYIDAGIDPRQVGYKPRPRAYTKDGLVSMVKADYAKGEDVRPSRLWKRYPGFWGPVRRFFGGKIINLYAAAEIDPEVIGVQFPTQHYTKERLVELVKGDFEAGKDVRPTSLQERYPGFYDARRRIYAGDRVAVYAEAGIDPKDVGLEPSYSTKDLLSELRRLHEKGEDLSAANMRKNHNALLQNLSKRFGGRWYSALEAAGISSQEWRRQREEWTKDEIIKEIRKLQRQGAIPSHDDMRRTKPALLAAAQSHLGGWYAALEAAGIDSKAVRLHGTYSRDRLVAEVRAAFKRGENVSPKELTKTYPGLYSVVRRAFGGKTEALYAAAGIDPRETKMRMHRSPEGILEEIRQLHDKGEDLSHSNILKKYPALEGAARARYGGSWYKAVGAAGFDQIAIRRQREPYTKGEILEALKQLQAQGLPLAYSSVRDYDQNLSQAAINRFGKYKHAIEALGLDYNDVRKSWQVENFRGAVFEGYVLETLRALGRKFAYQQRHRYRDGTCIPDFVDRETGEWIDAKLRSVTPEVLRAIGKYLTHTNKITIIYLHHSKTKEAHRKRWLRPYGDSVTFKAIKDFYPELVRAGADGLIEKIELLRRGIARPNLQARLKQAS